MGKRSQYLMGKVRNLNICQVNVRSILATTRLLDLEILCANHDIDILCVTETWLSTKSTPLGSSLITLPGYQSPFRRDRSGRRGGGVAMYVRNGITATVIPFQENIESSCVKVSLSKRRHIYIVSLSPTWERHSRLHFKSSDRHQQNTSQQHRMHRWGPQCEAFTLVEWPGN